MNNVNRILLFSFLALIGLSVSVSCRKKKDTIAIIYVKDVADQPVAGARVVLYGQSTTGQPSSVVLYDTTQSNSSGEAKFNFNDVYQLGQAGVAVLNIEAYKDGAIGEGIIKIEQETTSTATVYIQ